MSKPNGYLAPESLPATPGLWNRLWGLARAEAKQRLAEPLERPQEVRRATGGDHTCLIRFWRIPLLVHDGTSPYSHYDVYVASHDGSKRTSDIGRAYRFACPGAAADWWAGKPRTATDGMTAAIVRPDGEVVTELTAEIIGPVPITID